MTLQDSDAFLKPLRGRERGGSTGGPHLSELQGTPVLRYSARKKEIRFLTLTLSFALMVISFFAVMMFGKYEMTLTQVVGAMFSDAGADINFIVREVRAPRVACTALVGAALSISGLAMQSLFKNPMASPSILGLSSGASFGASMAISFGIGGAVLGAYSVPLVAFLFCFVSMIAVFLISYDRLGTPTVTLLLAGIAVSAFFNGAVSLMQFVASEDTLAEIVYWTMGSFNKCYWSSVYLSVLPILFGVSLIAVNTKELNLISLGEEQASNLGVNVGRVRLMLIIGTCFCVAGSVSVAGTIGFVGLIMPHIFRMAVGSDHRFLVPLCIFGGATFMMYMDLISKAAFAVSVPVGILTSLLGAPFFVYVMRKNKRNVWS